MSGRQLCMGIMVAAMLAAAAVAQDGKNELGGAIGRTLISDQGIKGATFFDPVIHSGGGVSFDVEYGRRLYVAPVFSIAGEMIVMYNPDEDVNGGATGNAVVPPDYKQLFITPGARLNLFPTTAVSPWVSGGVGFGHFSQANTLVYGGTNPGKSTTSATVEGGVGLDVRVWKSLTMRAEARDFYSGEPDFPLAPTGKTRQHNFFVGLGAFWRF